MFVCDRKIVENLYQADNPAVYYNTRDSSDVEIPFRRKSTNYMIDFFLLERNDFDRLGDVLNELISFSVSSLVAGNIELYNYFISGFHNF